MSADREMNVTGVTSTQHPLCHAVDSDQPLVNSGRKNLRAKEQLSVFAFSCSPLYLSLAQQESVPKMFKLLSIVPLLDLERFEVLSSFRHYLRAQCQGNHTMDRVDITPWTAWTSHYGPRGHHTMDPLDITPWTA